MEKERPLKEGTNEIKLTITAREDGSTNVKLSMDADIPFKTLLVAMEMGKKQMFEAFSDYCKENNINISESMEKYHEITVKELSL